LFKKLYRAYVFILIIVIFNNLGLYFTNYFHK